MTRRPCDHFDELMEELLAGQISDDEMPSLLGHLETCSSCRAVWDLHDDLSDLAPDVAEPSDHELARMRRRVKETIRAEGRPIGDGVPWTRIAAAAAAVFAVLALGFVAGRSTGAPGGGETAADRPAPRSDVQLASLISESSEGHRDLAAIEESPFIYSDIQVRDVAGDQVALAFNVTTHMELVRPIADPVVTEIMVQGLLQPGSLGSRLRTISLAPALDPRVRDALIRTMLEDKSVAVRMKAQERLVESAPDDRVEAAFLEVLTREESVRMRLDAIDYLAEHGVEAGVIEGALMEGPEEPSGVVLARVRERMSS